MDITICSSMKVSKQMLEAKVILSELGHKVTLPKHTEEYAKLDFKEDMYLESAKNKIEEDLIRDYFNKIEISDAILIINETKNGIDNYIRGNSLIEMAFAHVLYKKIYLKNPIPKMSYTDELIAMEPQILNGDLTKIK